MSRQWLNLLTFWGWSSFGVGVMVLFLIIPVAIEDEHPGLARKMFQFGSVLMAIAFICGSLVVFYHE